ncbi:hypothetical protein JW826_02710 [Candidatus Woesearchaeota archaeon]|nr:hypothetical protein [Candidatus Woesearchaeota archaeon]
MNTELKKSLETRQENLIFLLKNKKNHLNIEKQHQIYGAIKEIDYILRMMKYTTEEDEEQLSLETASKVEAPGSAIESSSQEEVTTQQMTKVSQREKKFKIALPFKFRFQKDEP